MELNKEFIALIAAIGLFAGTLITAFTNYLLHVSRQSHEWKVEKNRRKIEKGEQLYEALIQYKKLIFTSHMSWISCLDGGFKPSEIGDKADEILKDNPGYKGVGDKVVLISGVYFPDISMMVNEARIELKPANSVLFNMQSGKIDDKSKAKNTILDAGRNFDAKVDKILALLSAKIRKL